MSGFHVRAAGAWQRHPAFLRDPGRVACSRPCCSRERISPSRLAGALVIVAGLGVIGSESIAHIGLDGVQGDLIFVLTGLMFAGFATLVRYWRVSAVSAARRHQRAVAAAVSVLCDVRADRRGSRRSAFGENGLQAVRDRECLVRTRGDVSVHGLDPASRRRPRRDFSGNGAGIDPAVQLAIARRAADRCCRSRDWRPFCLDFYLAQRSSDRMSRAVASMRLSLAEHKNVAQSKRVCLNCSLGRGTAARQLPAVCCLPSIWK